MRLRSRTSGTHYGSFQYSLALCEHSFSLKDKADFDRFLKGEFRDAAPDLAEDTTYRFLSPIHELRHFQDQFGTLAGISLFQSRILTLKRFARAVRELWRRNATWRLPIADWLKDTDCPTEVRAFHKVARAERLCANLFLGNFLPIKTDGHLEPLIVEVDTDLGLKLDAATLRVSQEGNATARNETILYPFGVEVLFEASAHAITRSIGGAVASPTVEAALEQRLRVPLTHRTAVEEAVTPYMILDLLVTRHMRKNGYKGFPRDLILGLADEVLSCCPMIIEELPDGRALSAMDRPGTALLDVLDKGDIGAFAEGRVKVAAEVDAVYTRVLKQIEQGGDWDTVLDDGSLDADVAIWEAYAAQHFIRPLLELRRATRHDAFRTVQGFVNVLNSLPAAMSVIDGRLTSRPNMPERVIAAWWKIALVDEFVSALVAGRPLACPRAHDSIPGLAGSRLARDGRCSTHIALGCGTFGGHGEIELPVCWFQNGLVHTRFLPASPPI